MQAVHRLVGANRPSHGRNLLRSIVLMDPFTKYFIVQKIYLLAPESEVYREFAHGDMIVFEILGMILSSC